MFVYVDELDGDVFYYKIDRLEDYVKFEWDMIFVGFIGMFDFFRFEVCDVIVKCKIVGIRIIVIIGDNKNIVEIICREIGVFGYDEDFIGKSYIGREFDVFSYEEKIVVV